MTRKTKNPHFTENKECQDELQHPAMPDLIPSVILSPYPD